MGAICDNLRLFRLGSTETGSRPGPILTVVDVTFGADEGPRDASPAPRGRVVLVVTRGSHQQFKHPSKPGRVTIAGQLNDDIAPGTLKSILRQAQLKE